MHWPLYARQEQRGGRGELLSSRGLVAGPDTLDPLRLGPAQDLALRSRSEVVGILDGVIAAMQARGFSDSDRFAVRLTLEEALVNALKHGHKDDPGKQVRVRYRVGDHLTLIEVEDQGEGFDPDQVPDPFTPEGLERSCGRGLLLMRHYLNWVRYNERGNRVILCKYRSSAHG
jgi:serine/threonine-protein kinase RsbW